MQLSPFKPIALAVLTVWASAAHAVGLGDIRVNSALGQALNVSITLIGSESVDLSSNCIRAKIESSDGVLLAAPAIAVTRGTTGSEIKLNTRQPVNEPAVTVAVDVTCGGQVHREFQILLDPAPLLATVGSSPVTRDVASNDNRIGRRTSGIRTEGIPVPRSAGSSRVARPPVKTMTASAGEPTTGLRSNGRLASSALLGPPRSVLKLSNESLSKEDLRAIGQLKLSSDLQSTDSPTATASVPPSEELGAARRRFAMILRGEDPLQSAEKSQAAEQAQIVALQREAAAVARARSTDRVVLEEMRQRALPMHWIIGLVALLLTSLGAALWLAWRLAQLRKAHDASPWESALPDVAPVPASLAAAEPEEFVAPRKSAVSGLFGGSKKPQVNLASVPEGFRNVGNQSDDRTERLQPAVTRSVEEIATAAAATDAANREALQFYPAKLENLKVEEISDVMQEAEFWMSLNDPQRAIEILEPYSNVDLPDSPVPWLYLLDLYRGTDERVKYDVLQARTQRLFNAKIPTWDEDGDITDGRTIEDYPHVVERICEYWETSHILLYLESLIFDNREGARQGFDLGVYQEIMLLMTIARGMESARAADNFGTQSSRQISAVK